MASEASLAFDAAAATYDGVFGRNPVGRVFRWVFQERLRRSFRSGERVLDLGCGTGEDALLLASSGVSVHALDVSAAMVEAVRRKAAGVAGGARLLVEQRPAEAVGELDGPFDGAYSDFGALNCASLEVVGAGLARVLRPGAPVLLGFMGRFPLPAMIERGLTARGEPRGRTPPRVAGVALPVRYPRLGEIRRAMGPSFRWRGGFALGVLVPGPEHGAWAGRNPQAFAVLAAIEGIVRHLPLVRAFGDHVVLVGERR
jgi:SAM-dependent methyltransferase